MFKYLYARFLMFLGSVLCAVKLCGLGKKCNKSGRSIMLRQLATSFDVKFNEQENQNVSLGNILAQMMWAPETNDQLTDVVEGKLKEIEASLQLIQRCVNLERERIKNVPKKMYHGDGVFQSAGLEYDEHSGEKECCADDEVRKCCSKEKLEEHIEQMRTANEYENEKRVRERIEKQLQNVPPLSSEQEMAETLDTNICKIVAENYLGKDAKKLEQLTEQEIAKKSEQIMEELSSQVECVKIEKPKKKRNRNQKTLTEPMEQPNNTTTAPIEELVKDMNEKGKAEYNKRNRKRRGLILKENK